MKIKNILLLATAIVLLSACKSTIEQFNSNYSLQLSGASSDYKNGSTVNLEIIDAASMGIDSVVWMENGGRIDGEMGITLSRKLTNNSPLGNVTYEAHIYKDGAYAVVKEKIKRLATKGPKVVKYEIVNEYPHLKESYTQGLEFHNGDLYESTGQYRESDLRKVDVKTGIATQKMEMKDHFFAEGMTIMNDKIYQLTWRSGYGFVYDLNFNKIDEFKYNASKEGWGLTNDGNYLYKSDGTDKIWRLDPETLEELDYITVTSNKQTFDKINELEFVNGKIYANKYQYDGIMVIDPQTGLLEAVIDVRGLKDQVTNNDAEDNVLNGIAYDAATGHFFVTGKRWEKLFEIKLTEQ